MYTMYSPGQVGLATFLGGPLGGGWLLALNFKRLGRPAQAWITIAAVVAALALLVAFAVTASNKGPMGLGLASIFIMRMIAQSLQGNDYQQHLAHEGRKASSWHAAGFGLLGLAITIAAAAGVGGAIGMLGLPPHVEVNHAEIYYANGAKVAEANAVGQELVALGYATGGEVAVEVTRDAGRAVVAFVVKDIAFTDVHLQLQFHTLAASLSDKALGHAPVDIWLCDDTLEPKIKLRWENRPQ
jgi:hypothetical protein